MRRLAVGGACALIVVLAHTVPAVGAGDPSSARARTITKPSLERSGVEIVPGSYIVQLRAGVKARQARAALSFHGAQMGRAIGFGIVPVRVPPGLPVGAAIARIEASGHVVRAVPNYYLERAETFPTDPGFISQWGLHNTAQAHPVADPPPSTWSGAADADVDAPLAWDSSVGDPGTVIAVVDSGIDIAHPDLSANIWVNPGETAANGLDDDSNGFVDDVRGWDFENNDNSLEDLEGHGTQIAGVVGAPANNGVGISGLCPGCTIMAVKSGLDQLSSLQGIAYAANNGADIITYSTGHPILWDPVERKLLQQVTSRGILITVAAGNANGDNDMWVETDFDRDGTLDSVSPDYPGTYNLKGILSVAASTDGDKNGYLTGCAFRRGAPNWPCAFTSWGHESVD
ncbi:MAG: S8 family serine peptidase, partial [Actinomycetota bacterium]|nr:S8 family serine peptidase [Actinomycetota bacterium]